jgi:dTDP-L-rhamnose 4-epimerase
MRVLVTGGAGFIGSAVVDLLVAEGFEVVVLDVFLPAAHRGEPSYLNPDATYVRADVRDTDAVARCLRGVDAVSHQAAMVGLGLDMRDAPDYAAHNDFGTAVLLAGLAAAGFTGRLVLASSMVVYGEGRYRCPNHGIVAPGPRPIERLRAGAFEPACPRCGSDLNPESVPESAPPDPRSLYAATKLHQEHLCACFTRETGVPLTILRYHNVYGPRMPADTPYSGVAAMFRSALEAGRAPRVFEDGAQRRDFIHVADVARANLLALADGSRTSHVCNIATGTPATVREMATRLCEATGGAVAPLVTGEFRLGDVRHVYACADQAQSVLGFRARISLPEGMRDFASAPLR